MSRMTPLLALRKATTPICRSLPHHACCAVQPLCGVAGGVDTSRVGTRDSYAKPIRRTSLPRGPPWSARQPAQCGTSLSGVGGSRAPHEARWMGALAHAASASGAGRVGEAEGGGGPSVALVGGLVTSRLDERGQSGDFRPRFSQLALQGLGVLLPRDDPLQAVLHPVPLLHAMVATVIGRVTTDAVTVALEPSPRLPRSGWGQHRTALLTASARDGG